VQIDISTYISTQFSNFLSDIPSIGEQDIESIDDVVTQFPYCQTLHFLKVKAAVGTANYEGMLEKAAIYASSRAVLHDFLIESTEVSGDGSLSIEHRASGDGSLSFEHRASGDEHSGDKLIDVTEENNIDNDEIFEEITEEKVNEHLSFEHRASGDGQSGDKLIDVIEENNIDNDEIFEEITEGKVNEHLSFEHRASGDGSLSFEHRASGDEQSGDKLIDVIEENNIDNDEIFDEITEEKVNEHLSFEHRASGDGQSGDKLIDVTEARCSQPDSPWLVANSPKPDTPQQNSPQIETYDHHDSVLIKEIEEDAILVIAQSTQPEKSQPESLWLESQQSPAQKPESNPSLYNDDKLPFTFLWWLNKTRKEHYENNQPHVEPKVNAPTLRTETVNNPMLNQQIAENILLHKALDNYVLGNNTPEPVTKEDFIIKKFIIEEPQIKPLPASKLDTENKAKASSADLGELVSETLAKIYVEQMLYAKALETYRKLSLKYPEKSSYFTSQIKYLELKVN